MCHNLTVVSLKVPRHILTVSLSSRWFHGSGLTEGPVCFWSVSCRFLCSPLSFALSPATVSDVKVPLSILIAHIDSLPKGPGILICMSWLAPVIVKRCTFVSTVLKKGKKAFVLTSALHIAIQSSFRSRIKVLKPPFRFSQLLELFWALVS